MKVTIVPAQVTTVEDRITGNLSVSQIGLFALPVFGGSILFAVIPPSMEASAVKIWCIGVLALMASILAIRVKGLIIFVWVCLLLRYVLRPRQYVFNKNTISYRTHWPEHARIPEQAPRNRAPLPRRQSRLEIHHALSAQSLLDNPQHQVRFQTTKQGGLNVHISNVQEKSI